ncbi:hypothetical protein [Marinagarivorans algicola]|uniref:hypothetical protein n=1 Tax=Marinagarivorans algicola TaxID=1513270 RepID=UPI000A76A773|nr:hypothetical protein [Marinagarivorans algicola]
MVLQKHNSRCWITAARVIILGVGCLAASIATAGAVEQAKRLHERIAGVPPSDSGSVLQSMADDIAAGNAKKAAYTAMQNDAFYNVTLVNWAAPWTNREQNVFVDLNDYTATVVGLVRDDADFRALLFGDIIYHAPSITPAYAVNNNAHYEAIESAGVPLQTTLTKAVQSTLTGLPSQATAGVMTTRAGAKAFFKAGTNRAQLRFTLLNHLCHDLEQLHDVTRVPDRIRQDVSRSPGGDSRAFLNGCLGCHSGMDPLAQAFAYYNYDYDADNDLTGEQGQLQYNQVGMVDTATGTRVQAKYHFNAATFRPGFITPDDEWRNYWREGVNANLGWSTSLPGTGIGAKSMGQELASSEAFASCQATKVFKAMCFREPSQQADRNQITAMVSNFKAKAYSAKELFADAAIYCMGE